MGSKKAENHSLSCRRSRLQLGRERSVMRVKWGLYERIRIKGGKYEIWVHDNSNCDGFIRVIRVLYYRSEVLRGGSEPLQPYYCIYRQQGSFLIDEVRKGLKAML